MKTCPSWQLLLICANKFPLHHWAVLSHVFLFGDYPTQKWSSEITGRCKWWTSTYFLLPDTSVPMEPNPVTMQMEATCPPKTSELTYIKHTSIWEVSFLPGTFNKYDPLTCNFCVNQAFHFSAGDRTCRRWNRQQSVQESVHQMLFMGYVNL
jgi:hypothetical protein